MGRRGRAAWRRGRGIGCQAARHRRAVGAGQRDSFCRWVPLPAHRRGAYHMYGFPFLLIGEVRITCMSSPTCSSARCVTGEAASTQSGQCAWLQSEALLTCQGPMLWWSDRLVNLKTPPSVHQQMRQINTSCESRQCSMLRSGRTSAATGSSSRFFPDRTATCPQRHNFMRPSHIQPS